MSYKNKPPRVFTNRVNIIEIIENKIMENITYYKIFSLKFCQA